MHGHGGGGQCSPDHEPEVKKRAILMEGAQRQVVHAEEVRLARLDSLAAVECGTHSMLCTVEELQVELGVAHVVVHVVAHVVA